MNCPICHKPAKTERGLRKHLTGTRPYGGHELDAQAAADAAARAAAQNTTHRASPNNTPSDEMNQAGDGSMAAGRAVRPGHYATVKYMTTPAFAEIVRLFDSYDEIGGAYFRPLDTGVRALDLHATSPKPRIGIGDNRASLIRRGATASELAPTMPARIAYLQSVRSRQRDPSLENQFEAQLIREAQRDRLALPGFPAALRFVHSQWRIDTPTSGHHEFTDLLAVDIDTGKLVVIEIKARPDNTAADQALRYTRSFSQRSAELLAFFEQVARMMGTLYDCPELAEINLTGVYQGAFMARPTTTGTHVERVEATTGPNVPDRVTGTPSGDRLDIGPQYSADPPFRARMRLHQSAYRSAVLKVPYGTGPGPSSQTYYGNMLDAAAADAGANFLSSEIFDVTRERMAAGPGVEAFRCLRNMLSSQPMCFNLFGPLVRDHELATRLIAALLPGEVDEVLDVRIEYAPSPKMEYLDDRTSFDAFIAYTRPDGEEAFLGIETKLTEPFSPTEYLKPAYVTLTERDDSIWTPAAWPSLRAATSNQLWRNHLLVEVLRRRPDTPHGGSGRLVIVRHPDDEECAHAMEHYRHQLVEPSATFADWAIDQIIKTWHDAARSDQERSWLQSFAQRYLKLSVPS